MSIPLNASTQVRKFYNSRVSVELVVFLRLLEESRLQNWYASLELKPLVGVIFKRKNKRYLSAMSFIQSIILPGQVLQIEDHQRSH